MARVMIEAAVNGNARRELDPHVPYSPAEIADVAVAACQAGAALIHFHVRDPQSGAWVHDVSYYAEVYRRARERCGALLWPTFPLSGEPAARFSHFFALAEDSATRPDLGGADMGSVNLVAYDPRSKTYSGGRFIYQNSYDTIRYFLESSRQLGLRPTLQIFDPSFVRAALVFLDQGLLTEPLIIKFYLGGPYSPFGLPPRSRVWRRTSRCWAACG